ncbi:MAG TPA: hypothetical protein GX010_01450 [Erysipelotrichaceae bacterium]|nr:hypothetical protein [Erysipelotrichaceae bacterium]
MKSKRNSLFLVALTTMAIGLCIPRPNAVGVSAASNEKTRRTYQYKEGDYFYYDFLGFFNLTNVESSGNVEVSLDGVSFEAPLYPCLTRYVRSTQTCRVYADATDTAKIERAVCSASCWENREVEKIYDGVKKENYMNPTMSEWTLDFEFDDYYELNGFCWHVYQVNAPKGNISYSLNGSSFTKWVDFKFDKKIVDPTIGDEDYLMTEYSPARCKFVRVNVTGSAFDNIFSATREVIFYGKKYEAENVDPLSITINEKLPNGAINTPETAYYPGDKFQLTASLGDNNSLSKVEWESLNPINIRVDEFGSVEIIRGGIDDIYKIRAFTIAPNGTVYEDITDVYIRRILPISGLSELSWYGVSNFYGPAAYAFDGVIGVFGNWMQPVDGVNNFQIICDFKQPIPIGKINIYIGVNSPRSINVIGYLNGVPTLVASFDIILSNKILTVPTTGTFDKLVFDITNNDTASTIYEIEIFNDESFDIESFVVEEPTENRGPKASGNYDPTVPSYDPTDPSVYDDRFNHESSISEPIFKYSKVNVTLIVAAPVAGIAIILVVLLVIKGRKKI